MIEKGKLFLGNRLNRAYRDRGYITSGVFTEPKLQRNGIIFIPITEGKLEDVRITGLNRLRTNYVRNRIVRDEREVINQERLKQALLLLQVNHLIENISATLLPGSHIGSSILEVEVEEDDPFYVELSLDNLGFPTFGSFRRQLKLNHDNLIGFGDRLNAAYTNSDGSNILENLSYTFPLNARDGAIALSYGVGEFEIIEPPLEDLDIDAEVNAFQLALRQPLYQTPRQEFALGLALTRTAVDTTLSDLPFPIVRGASEKGELNVSRISFYQDYLRRGRNDYFFLRSALNLGVDIFDATENDRQPDTNFFIWRGQTFYVRQLTDGLTLYLNSILQLSDRPLVYLEQTPISLFTIDREEEAFILRGYRRGVL